MQMLTHPHLETDPAVSQVVVVPESCWPSFGEEGGVSGAQPKELFCSRG